MFRARSVSYTHLDVYKRQADDFNCRVDWTDVTVSLLELWLRRDLPFALRESGLDIFMLVFVKRGDELFGLDDVSGFFVHSPRFEDDDVLNKSFPLDDMATVTFRDLSSFGFFLWDEYLSLIHI